MADGEVCDKCGTVHNPAKCQGHVDDAKREAYARGGAEARRLAKGKLRQCQLPPIKGLDVCGSHGGNGGRKGKEHTRAVGKQRVAEEKAMAILDKAVKTYGLPVDVDPVEALLDEVRWTAGHVAWLRERVQEIEQEALVWGRTKADDQQATEFPGVNTTEAAVPNVWLTLYQAERKHLVDVCKTAIAAKIDERRVRLAEQQGEILIGVIQAILTDLNLTPEQNARVPEIVPRHLRAVAG